MNYLFLIELIFIVYFLCINSFYLFINISSLFGITRYMKLHKYEELGVSLSEIMPPITILIPAYNEEKSITETVQSILQLEYPSLEIIVINDGSKDRTAERMEEKFEMREAVEKYTPDIKTETVNSIYWSHSHENLKLINKENGGKADALNTGINLARTPLVCCIDGDSILERESLKTIVRPFLHDDKTVAAGGTVRIANGCEIRDGFLKKAHLPKKLLPLFQVVEYLRAFLFGRMGWDPFNGLMIISGAFGLFRRTTLQEIGGYHTDNVAEDMELIIRMHRKMIEKDRSYRIRYVPDPVCWTEVPGDLESLRSQRIRWQHGLGQSLIKNISLLFKPGSGAAGWLSFPYHFFFEALGAVIEAAGYIYIATGLLLGFTSPVMAGAFFLAAVVFGILVSVVSFLLEVISFHVYDKPSDLIKLFSVAILENLGYRQLNSLWRFFGMLRLLKGGTGSWGEISRQGFDSTDNPQD